MITLTFYGLNMFALGDLSLNLLQDLTKKLSVKENEITLRVVESMIFYKGIDQNTWEVMVEIRLTENLKPLEALIVQSVTTLLKEQTIHFTFDFLYVSNNSRIQVISKDYPRYITEQNEVVMGKTNEKKEDVFTGNIFESVQEKLDANAQLFENEGEESESCTCGGQEGACTCGLHHH